MSSLRKGWKSRSARSVLLFLLGWTAGTAGEALLLLETQCSKVEKALLEDFRILAFLKEDIPQAKHKVIEEKIHALGGVQSVRFISPEQSLAELGRRDAELIRSVALLGGNPLPGAFEIRLDAGRIPAVSHWLAAARVLPELADFRYKELQANAIARVQLYAHFLTLVLSLIFCLWMLLAARLLWAKRKFLEGASEHLAPCFCGTGFGIGLAALLAYPFAVADMSHFWPPLWKQGLLMVFGVLGGWVVAGLMPRAKQVSGEQPKLSLESVSDTACCPS